MNGNEKLIEALKALVGNTIESIEPDTDWLGNVEGIKITCTSGYEVNLKASSVYNAEQDFEQPTLDIE